jgi:hypothetical protein
VSSRAAPAGGSRQGPTNTWRPDRRPDRSPGPSASADVENTTTRWGEVCGSIRAAVISSNPTSRRKRRRTRLTCRRMSGRSHSGSARPAEVGTIDTHGRRRRWATTGPAIACWSATTTSGRKPSTAACTTGSISRASGKRKSFQCRMRSPGLRTPPTGRSHGTPVAPSPRSATGTTVAPAGTTPSSTRREPTQATSCPRTVSSLPRAAAGRTRSSTGGTTTRYRLTTRLHFASGRVSGRPARSALPPQRGSAWSGRGDGGGTWTARLTSRRSRSAWTPASRWSLAAHSTARSTRRAPRYRHGLPMSSPPPGDHRAVFPAATGGVYPDIWVDTKFVPSSDRRQHLAA